MMGGEQILSVDPTSVAPGGLLESSTSTRRAMIAGKLGIVIELIIEQRDGRWLLFTSWHSLKLEIRTTSKPIVLPPAGAIELAAEIRGRPLTKLLELVANEDLVAPRQCTLRLGEKLIWLDAGAGRFSVLNGHFAGRQLVLFAASEGGRADGRTGEKEFSALLGKAAGVRASIIPTGPLACRIPADASQWMGISI